MNRRQFLSRGGVVLVSTTPILMAAEQAINEPLIKPFVYVKQSVKTVATGLNRRQWQAISSVQTHLFPSEKNTPNAKSINARAFLYAALSDATRDDADRRFIKQGIVDLQALCWQTHKMMFNQLNSDQKEQVLRQFEKNSAGRRWIISLLGYIFEALLTDPVYGGNPDQMGWRWLKHQAGFPRPSTETRYFLL